VRLKHLEKTLGVNRIYLKDESKNPHGTIKDRRNLLIIKEALKYHVDKLVLITSGNNGYSLAKFASETHLKVICIVNRDLPDEIKASLEKAAYQVIEHNLNYKILRPEEIISFAREREEEVIWEVTNGYEDAYENVFKEILEEITPTHIVVPVGSGGIYMGTVQAININEKAPSIVGIGIQNTTSSFADKLATPWTPYAKALNYQHSHGHPIFRMPEPTIKRIYNKYKYLTAFEPSSSIVFAAFDAKIFKKDDVIVLVNSGKSPIQ